MSLQVSDHVLRILHGTAAFLHLSQFGYGEALVNTVYKNKSFFNIANPVATRPGEVGAIRGNDMGSYQLSQIVPIFSLLSTINHAWSFFDFKRYLSYVEKGYNPVRWAEYSLSAGLMYYVVASLSGLVDVKSLAFLVFSNFALQYTGYSVEKDVGRSLHSFNEDHGQFLYQSALRQEIVGFFIFAAQIIPIWTAFFTSVSQAPDQDEMPAFVWAVIFIITAFFLSFGLLSIAYLRGADRKSTKSGFRAFRQPDFRMIEVGFLILSFLSKTFLMNITLFGSAQSRAPTTSP